MRKTLFFANKGFHPCMGFESPDDLARLKNSNKININAFVNQMQKLQEILQNQMLLAQVDYKCYVNYYWGTAPQYRVGNMV